MVSKTSRCWERFGFRSLYFLAGRWDADLTLILVFTQGISKDCLHLLYPFISFYISFYILLSPFLDGVCSGAGQCLLKCCNLPWCRCQPVMIKGSHWRPQSARNECILRSNMTPSKMVQNTKVPRQSQATESDDVKSAGWGQCFIQWHGPTQCNAGRVMHRIRTRQHSLHDESSRCLTVCRTKIQSTNQSTSS